MAGCSAVDGCPQLGDESRRAVGAGTLEEPVDKSRPDDNAVGHGDDLPRLLGIGDPDTDEHRGIALLFAAAGDAERGLTERGSLPRDAHHADRVMVAGRWVVVDGAIPGLDMTGLVQRHTASAKALHAA